MFERDKMFSSKEIMIQVNVLNIFIQFSVPLYIASKSSFCSHPPQTRWDYPS